MVVAPHITAEDFPPSSTNVVDDTTCARPGKNRLLRRRGSFVLHQGEHRAGSPVNAGDEEAVMEMLSKISIQERARAESWAIPRSQLVITTKVGSGAGSEVFKCRWRGLDCAAERKKHCAPTHEHNIVLMALSLRNGCNLARFFE